MSLGCSICLACEFGSDDSLRSLVRYQARQLDRLSHLAYGLPYTAPDLDDLDDEPEEPERPQPRRSTLATLEGILNQEDIFRRPGRVAAPRLIERLAEAGIYLTVMEEAS